MPLNGHSEYGRRRVKKPKPTFPTALEQTSPSVPSQSSAQPLAGSPTVAEDMQASLDIPLPEPAHAESIEPPVLSEASSETKTEIQPESKPEARIQPKPESRSESQSTRRSDTPAPRRQDRGRPQSERFEDRRRERRESRPEPRPEQRSEQRAEQRSEQRLRDKSQRRQPPVRQRIRVSIIIPAYNEEGNIKALLEQFQEVVARAGNDWEVVLVDDGSTDKTAERARDAAIHYHWLRVISYRKNRGLTGALETGFQNARGSIYVFYPADLQYHPQDIPRMINRIDRGADLVTGWKQGRYQKRFVSFVYNGLCRAFFNLKVHDLNSVKAFKKEVVDKVRMRRDWHRYMVVLASEAGFVIDEVKVNVYPRYSGTSKFGTGRILGGLLDLMAVKFQTSFSRKPLRLFGTLGILSILAGIVTGLIAIYLRFLTPYGSRVWLYLVILFVLSGLMLFSLGFLAEVIVSLRDEFEQLRGRSQSHS
jgi:glycosyltransferase involved in cell wall biosynthesis